EGAAMRTVDVIRAAGGRAEPLAGDVAEPGDWLSPILANGDLHGIVHNAGYDLQTPVGETDRAVYDRLLRVMVTGPFEMTQRLFTAMSPGGAVIFIASVHASLTEPGMSAYASAKGALVSLVRAMAQDLGPRGLRALTISPGYIDTPLLNVWFEAEDDPAAA